MSSNRSIKYYSSIILYIFILIAAVSIIYLVISPDSLIAFGVAFVLITSLYIIWIEKRREKEIKNNKRQRDYDKRIKKYNQHHKKRQVKREFKDYGKVVQFKDKNNDD